MRLLSVRGIPIYVHLSWFITLAFVTAVLALRFYPNVFPPRSPYRDDEVLHWTMALVSGVVFFGSILLHELAHSVVAQAHGIPVKGITLFIFGGVAQITAEPKRPLHEFVMAVVGPLASALVGGAFFLLWWLFGGLGNDKPLPLMLQWLFLMNLVVAAFNLAPGFPMDGGRLLRAGLWALTGDFPRATRLATGAGRLMGWGLMVLGGVTALGFVRVFDPWSGLWLFILGTFLSQSARQSLVQAQALEALERFRADEIMTPELETIDAADRVRTLRERGIRPRRRFIFFVSDAERVVGVLTEKELAAVRPERRAVMTAGEAMAATEHTPVAAPADDGARLLQKMEASEVWHLPVVDDGRVVGVVSKETLLHLVAQRFGRRSTVARQP